MNIRINKATDPLAWYAKHIGEVLPVERFERNRHPDQGIPEDVYWCREGGTYNPINYVRKSDATEVSDEEHACEEGQPGNSTTADHLMSKEHKIKLLAALLMSRPETLVAVGLGKITGNELATHLLKLAPRKKENR